MRLDAQKLIDGIHDYIGRALSPVADRVKALEERPPIPGQKGDPGRDGKDAPPVDEDALAARIVAQIPAPHNGADGKSVTLEDLEPLLSRLVVEAVAKIPAAKDGDPGAAGKDGRDGESVHPDTVRAMVVDQVRLQVAEIPRPKDGEPGRDATAIEYRDGIDEEKSYPRGTHALYRGGVIVALRATDPLGDDLTGAGWSVALNGTNTDIEESLDEGRTVRRTVTFTNGKAAVTERKVPVVLYRDVWKHDREYERGDLVTWDGSVWHCQAERTKARPGSSMDWKLAVKRGNHGRDGKDSK